MVERARHRYKGLPGKHGLYDPRNEHDACGIGCVVNIKNRKSHRIIDQGLQVLKNLTHRGAVGADPLAGDGAGILIQMPDAHLRAVCGDIGIDLPEPGEYSVGMLFMPQAERPRADCVQIVEELVEAEGQHVLGWRDVPVDNSGLGESVLPTEPYVRQIFVRRGDNCADRDAFERKQFVIRKQAEHRIDALGEACDDFYMSSFSSRTIVYKGMLLAHQVGEFYLDLKDERMVSALALVHQRFSTNTFPSWRLAHPYRMICHNGEINTLRGNINWMAARRHLMKSKLLGDDLEKLWPLITEGQSDSASFDNALELLVQSGYSLAHAMMMLIPEAWTGNPLMDERRRAFYEYHAAIMEPWDGPAAVAFTDGRQIGATLDRNGLRPARYVITDDDVVVMGSEVGVLPIDESRIVKKWRLQPGKMLLIDLEQGCILDDDDIKAELSSVQPYQEWLDRTRIVLEDLPATNAPVALPNRFTLLDRQQAFGYTQEDLKFLMSPMASTGQEAVGSMGNDIPISALSSRPKLLYSYFKQVFAQVTNPPIDPIREELVMSLLSLIGPRPNLLGIDDTTPQKRLEVRQPVLTNKGLEKIRSIGEIADNAFKTLTLDLTYPAEHGAEGMRPALDSVCAQAEKACQEGYNILVLSDRAISEDRIAIPALLGTSAAHHHLVRKGLRTLLGLVVETGEAREVHHFCTLAGYGAEAINPYLAFETLSAMRDDLPEKLTDRQLYRRYIKAVDKGILKVMSKMGISTYQSYCGAQIFDAVGLAEDFVEQCFTGTASTIGGIGLAEVARETVERHKLAYGDAPVYRNALDVGGEYAYRLRGEEHYWTPETVMNLQHAVRGEVPEKYRAFAKQVNDQDHRMMTVRGLFELIPAETPVPLDEVEPASEIVKRFSTGAMSFGSISREAHSTLAIAMNRIGGKSNTGEGGEEPDRFRPMPNGDSMRSAIKQVASGRFGVTAEYLANSDMMQIKMAQGAKPGEGGQLPGHKVNAVIAKVRHSTPGVGLISPPPHHDIYSIEDLAQLIYDLKNANKHARINVKLVSEVGVGTIAAGVAKGHADVILISGTSGGTGASPQSSIHHAGLPWELGIAETHQTLVLNNLRSRVVLETDGQMKTGRDVAIAALLGAEEYGFSTAPLIVLGCIMMRVCHLDTCPVGVATQNPELRKKYTGNPAHVVDFMHFVATEFREIMAKMGFRTVDEMIGRTDRLEMRKSVDHWKAKGIDLSSILFRPEVPEDWGTYCQIEQDHGIQNSLDETVLMEICRPTIERGERVEAAVPIKNVNRTVGTIVGSELTRRYGLDGLEEDTIRLHFSGSAGQSFGAFVPKSMTLVLEGDSNDYTGKGLSGGKVVIYPPKESTFAAEENIIIGNVAFYGATGGEAYVRGIAGERFCVRNSGVRAVVESVGDHCCEYMTGGRVVVLGPTGRNFAAGMSGGIAYVYDPEGDFEGRCNTESVFLELVEEDEEAELLGMIRKHLEYTGSEVAKRILEDWTESLPGFVKVIPKDYKRMLEHINHAQQRGLSGDEALMAAFEENKRDLARVSGN